MAPTKGSARSRAAIRPLVSSLVALIALGALGASPAGCMSRPVVQQDPSTTIIFQTPIKQTAVDKIDLLFMIDDSASMGDKQSYLKEVIPDLIKRLVKPNCVAEDDVTQFVGRSNDDGSCDKGKLEFKPVHDLHIGIVTSSLGSWGSKTCTEPGKDTRGELFSTAGAGPLPDAQPSGFLYWFPVTEKPAQPGAVVLTVQKTLEDDFQKIVSSIGQRGCGLEAQLESWYRFLVQPDPWASVTNDGTVARLEGVNATILKQRHDFLRPDSLVAVVVLSDENDSSVDPRSIAGHGWQFLDPPSAFAPPRGTSACDADPNGPGCTWCGFKGHESDPNCQKGPYTDSDTDLELRDNVNLRHVHMKRKYGIDPQFPISRYVTGLTSTTVPDRNGEYPGSANSYVGKANCTNPLFAASLPDGSNLDPAVLCNANNVGKRSKDSIFFAHIGGVPHELLHFDPKDAEASKLKEIDWARILGRDPAKGDTTGIDPHMIESANPRQGIAPPASADDADGIVGRDYDSSLSVSGGSDLMYACTFHIADRDCTLDDNRNACDCPTSAGVIPASTKIPPLCSPTTRTTQIRAKTYPTIRELHLAKLMGAQGIVSSLCPIHVKEEIPGDELYGYRPAVTAIVDRLKGQLAGTCVPRPLKRNDVSKQVACLVLESLPVSGDQSACDKLPGLKAPSAEIVARFRQTQREKMAPGDPDPAKFPVCEVTQLAGQDLTNGSCAKSPNAGWCYVEGKAAGFCPQAVQFSEKGNPGSGVAVSIQCLESAGL